jgi:hypothetical protein
MARSPTPSQPSRPHGRGRSRFKRTEASRLVKAATDAGLTVLGIEAVGDSLRVITGKPGEPGKPGDADVEQWLSKQNAHQR